jgi:hypothetical protein
MTLSPPKCVVFTEISSVYTLSRMDKGTEMPTSDARMDSRTQQYS